MLPSPSASPRIVEGSIAPKQPGRRGQGETSTLDDRAASDETVDNHDHRNDEQKVDQRANDVENQEPANPENEEHYGDGPKHDGILARSELQVARQKLSPALRRPTFGVA
jgi:hypothetical protein